MQIEIELVGKTNRWSYDKPRVRIGRDPSCDVSLPGNEFPMISREHVVLEVTAAGVTLSDPRSANGTYLNGNRVTAAKVSSGDTLRLGSDGPELRIKLGEVQPAAPASPAGEATQVIGAPSAQATVVAAAAGATVVHSNARPDSGATMVGVQPGSDKAVRVSFGAPSAPSQPEFKPAPAITAAPVATPAAATATAAKASRPNAELEAGAEIVIEQKLNMMRNLLAVALIGILVLLCVIFYQGQQITKTQAAVADLQKGADSAVKQFTPALDARLSAFEQRVDGMDAKMQQSQDRFMQQMQQQTPKILDAYFNRKLQEVQRESAKAKR